MTTQTTAWPEGVIIRYLTVAGSALGRDDLTVDIRHDTLYLSDTRPNVTVARCAGCDNYRTEEWKQHAHRVSNGSSEADDEAREWAQAHAETCRAIPRSTA
ncbi:hypothetical protein [Streptomyces leeuwenhoekii]|uniref:Sle1_108 protein n=1 Tax=Streptomyces leeuwenhoekii TaxID=1437453 RepID=A0A0F7VL24_STRLW|nr:hypothetical protein [Streptomyces leeuwenhoekii]CQR59275.1 sle1_108 [Streptomyces leeuwenhoekii]